MAVNIICIGMAGSGKTTFVQRIVSYLYKNRKPPYVVNLDPAVLSIPFDANIDIRDSVKYDKVMEQYGLGPNGAIMTCLNLFTTKIDQVVNIIESRTGVRENDLAKKGEKDTNKDTKKNFTNENHIEHVIIDTPGQIEAFLWSASGAIITDSIASSGPTVIAYIIDTPRTTSPATFMSNMLYACSVLYKTKLPLIVVFNKIDAQDSKFAEKWMTDFESFQESLMSNSNNEGDEENSSYSTSLMNSMSLVLDEFYSTLDHVSVSSFTGEGVKNFFTIVDSKLEEYNNEYKVERENLIKDRKINEEKKRTENLTKLVKDLGISTVKDKKNKINKHDKNKEAITVSDAEDESDISEPDETAGIIGDNEYENQDINEEDNEDEEKLKQDLKSRYEAALQKASESNDNQTTQKLLNMMKKDGI